MTQTLLDLRKQLQTALHTIDSLIASHLPDLTGINPDDYLPVNPAPRLARHLYTQIRLDTRNTGKPELTDSQLKALLLANGWTEKRTERGTLLSPPPVSDLP